MLPGSALATTLSSVSGVARSVAPGATDGRPSVSAETNVAAMNWLLRGFVRAMENNVPSASWGLSMNCGRACHGHGNRPAGRLRSVPESGAQAWATATWPASGSSPDAKA